MMEIKISKSFGEVTVFNGFALNIQENKINAIVGPSGCGKTTLLQCIAGLTDYEGLITPAYRNIGYVFQEARLFPYKNVVKNLLMVENNLTKITELLKHFKAYDLTHKYPRQLSGGEKQRIAVIRAFLRNNELILMDEPFTALDYHLKQSLVEMIYELYEKTAKTIILVTHELDMALFLGHYIHVLSEKVTTLKETIENPYVYQELNTKSVVLLNKLQKLMKQ